MEESSKGRLEIGHNIDTTFQLSGRVGRGTDKLISVLKNKRSGRDPKLVAGVQGKTHYLTKIIDIIEFPFPSFFNLEEGSGGLRDQVQPKEGGCAESRDTDLGLFSGKKQRPLGLFWWRIFWRN